MPLTTFCGKIVHDPELANRLGGEKTDKFQADVFPWLQDLAQQIRNNDACIDISVRGIFIGYTRDGVWLDFRGDGRLEFGEPAA